MTTNYTWWHDNGNRIDAIDPKPVKSPKGYEAFSFFIHRKPNGVWSITESESGWNCGTRSRYTAKDAKADFLHCLNDLCTPERLRLRVQAANKSQTRGNYVARLQKIGEFQASRKVTP